MPERMATSFENRCGVLLMVRRSTLPSEIEHGNHCVDLTSNDCFYLKKGRNAGWILPFVCLSRFRLI